MLEDLLSDETMAVMGSIAIPTSALILLTDRDFSQVSVLSRLLQVHQDTFLSTFSENLFC